MWGILNMRVTSLVAVVAPRTVKIVKNGVFLKKRKRRKFAKNGILHFVFKLSQSSEIVLES